MVICVAREAPKLWRKICTEIVVEISLLAENWKFLLAGIFFQYIHGLAAHGIHYLHRPGPTLQDAGFFFFPVGTWSERAYMSETLFSAIFCSFALWTFHPFIFQSKKSTQFWCGAGFLLFWLLVKLSGYSHSIPLIFLVQTTIAVRCIKQFAWVLAVLQSFLIIASRKHYTVDVVVAWYTVNLVVFFVEKIASSSSVPLLPLTNKDKDSKNKEELQKLTDNNSVDTTD
ncbi:hypothetical protein FNV43_RR05060 [Rhamnella rubrinervis]|uniref:Sphingomyelin synthase-like domain-containing protein n=1 Tax=Rhamnella rubrinervis TaxID=2594499 RepID=A0A8K0MQB9_9ROSA|nr:hypothetical protein FNV43_RR05060 [Rhamnella rubrinervis]